MWAAADWLTRGTGETARAMLALLGTPLEWQGDQLQHAASGFVVQMHFDCTAGWPVAVLLLALAAFGSLARTPWPRLAAWAVAGAALVIVLNQVRLVALLWAGANTPTAFSALHEWAGPLALVAAGAAIVALALRPGATAPARCRVA